MFDKHLNKEPNSLTNILVHSMLYFEGWFQWKAEISCGNFVGTLLRVLYPIVESLSKDIALCILMFYWAQVICDLPIKVTVYEQIKWLFKFIFGQDNRVIHLFCGVSFGGCRDWMLHGRTWLILLMVVGRGMFSWGWAVMECGVPGFGLRFGVRTAVASGSVRDGES